MVHLIPDLYSEDNVMHEKETEESAAVLIGRRVRRPNESHCTALLGDRYWKC